MNDGESLFYASMGRMVKESSAGHMDDMSSSVGWDEGRSFIQSKSQQLISSVKREIAHLCRDVTPPTNRHPSDSSKMTKSPSQIPEPELLPQPAHNHNLPTNRLPTSLYSDPNFPPSWPLLPDTEGPVTFGDGGGPSDVRRPEWSTGDDTELGALTWVYFDRLV